MTALKLVFNIRAVIFDMDGVITDTMVYHMMAWRRVLARHGVPVRKEDIYKREGQKGIDSVEEIFRDYKLSFNEKLGRSILHEKEEIFKKVVKRRFVAGSRSFVMDLKNAGFKLALVTGTARHEVDKILPERIYRLFDVIVCGCDVQNGKPHPEPYLTALRKLKLQPKHAVVIENAPFGIRSSKAAGLRCLGLETSLPGRFLKEADAVFPSFSDIRRRVIFKVI